MSGELSRLEDRQVARVDELNEKIAHVEAENLELVSTVTSALEALGKTVSHGFEEIQTALIPRPPWYRRLWSWLCFWRRRGNDD